MANKYGVTQDGFREKPFIDSRQGMRDRWKTFYPQADDSDAAPEQQLFATVAAELADRGLEFPTESLWAALNEVYHAPYILTSWGSALDDAIKYKNMERRGATLATTTVVATGAAGYTIPATTVVRVPDGPEYYTTQDATIPSSGEIAVPIQAVEPGPNANRAAGTITETDDGNIDVTNAETTRISHISNSSPDTWVTVPNDERAVYVQLADVSDLTFSANLTELTWHVRNPSNTARTVDIQWAFIDDASGEDLGRTFVQRFALEAGESREVSTSLRGINLLSATTVRMALVNLASSWGDIEWGLDSGSGFPRNVFLDGTDQGTSMAGTVTSVGGGPADGGRVAESDESVKARYLLELFNFAGGSPNALLSRLRRINGVRRVKLFINREAETDGHGQPGKTVEAVLEGGDGPTIAGELFDSMGPTSDFVGNREFSVTDISGQVHPIKFSRFVEVPLYLTVRLRTSGTFPGNGRTLVKEELLRELGGFDGAGQEFVGRVEAGQRIWTSNLDAACHRVSGVEMAGVRVGRTPTDRKTDYLDLARDEVPATHPDLITVF